MGRWSCRNSPRQWRSLVSAAGGWSAGEVVRSIDAARAGVDGSYGVCCAARTLTGAFAETCLRAVGASLIPLARLEARSATELRVTGELRLVQLYGRGLARLGATALVSSGTYDVSQPWSRAVYAHPLQADGIVYRSNQDNDELCVALFDRCRDRLSEGDRRDLLADRAALARVLDRYNVGLP